MRIEEIFNAGLRAVDPEACVTRFMHLSDGIIRIGNRTYDMARVHRLIVVGAGKASAAMARAVETLLGNHIDQGLVITKYGHGVPLN